MDAPQGRWSSIEPDTLLTPRALVELIRSRTLSSGTRSPIGRSTIIDAIRTGDLRAVERGRGYLIVWSDFLDWFEVPGRRSTLAHEGEADAHA